MCYFDFTIKDFAAEIPHPSIKKAGIEPSIPEFDSLIKNEIVY
jgi:hypothetical protein